MRIDTTDVAIQRLASALRCRMRRRERYAKDGIRTDLPLICGSVDVDHCLVNGPLVEYVVTEELIRQYFVYVLYGL